MTGKPATGPKSQHKDQTQAGLGLYVHWPYCHRICPYCDFNIALQKKDDAHGLVAAIIADIQGQARMLAETSNELIRPLASLSFGGGTPSRLKFADMQAILAAAKAAFGFARQVEISLEANPLDVSQQNCTNWRQAGINRLSIGVQSLAQHELTFLGRDHKAADGLQAIQTAKEYFDNLSADFIYGLPGQSVKSWHEQLQDILALNLPHLSFYCLTIEPGTSFFKRQQRKERMSVGNDAMADLFEQTARQSQLANMAAYEISNHASALQFQSRHNLLYWQGENWIGVGPGAHGRVQKGKKRIALTAHANIKRYISQVGISGTGIKSHESLLPDEDLCERLMMGLRLTNGIDLRQMQANAGCRIAPARLKSALEASWVRIENHQLIACEPLLVDRIARELLL